MQGGISLASLNAEKNCKRSHKGKNVLQLLGESGEEIELYTPLTVI